MHNLKEKTRKWSWIVLLFFLITGLFYPAVGLVAILCMLAPLVVAIFRGRRWCAFYCPRGGFLEQLVSRFSLRQKYPALFKTVWFKWLIVVGLLSGFAIQLMMAENTLVAMGAVFVRMVLITTLAAFGLGITFIPRTWCGICPMGTLAAYIGRACARLRRDA
ncbi:MAG TPA: 4Fe-4S binding protein [Firmicutes bacterium]|nr:4Fe-4S binding protein [Bacillota bacterium]